MIAAKVKIMAHKKPNGGSVKNRAKELFGIKKISKKTVNENPTNLITVFGTKNLVKILKNKGARKMANAR
ncbi:MAG: hypothetical protein Tsb0015_11600 [Simkaniaceae bacterium]